jgi:hypothetical protein
VADDLFAWMNDEVEYHVDAMRGGSRSPFSAEVSSRDQQNFFERRWFTENPDGSVDYTKSNSQGRDWVLKTYGVKAYADVATEMKRLERKRGRRPVPEADPFQDAMRALTEPESEEPEQPEEEPV